MAETKIPVTSVDAPSSWDIHEGPPKSGVGSNFHPNVLVSLTAPKPLVQHFKGRHFVGGRYVLYFLLASSRRRVSLDVVGLAMWLMLATGSSLRRLRKSTTSTFPSMKVSTRLSRSPTTKSRSKGFLPPRQRRRWGWCLVAVPVLLLLSSRSNLGYMTLQPPCRLFGQVGLGQPPSFISRRFRMVPWGQRISGG